MSNRYSPLQLWLVNHARAFMHSLGGLLRTPLASAMTLMVIGVVMALPICLYILLNNVQQVSQHWQGRPSISIYLKQSVSTNQANTFMQQLTQQQGIAKLRYISPQQGLAQFTKEVQFKGLLADLGQNPLPGVIVVTPKTNAQSPQALQALLQTVKNNPLVDSAQLDMAWVKRLYFIVRLAERVTYALSILFALAVILIIGNTIRLTTQHYQQEIAVFRLMGASSGFIRRPLLYRGVLYGLVGGAIAWLFVYLMLWWLEKPAQALAATYNQVTVLHGISLMSGLLILLLCTLFGLFGSWIAVNKQLSSVEVV